MNEDLLVRRGAEAARKGCWGRCEVSLEVVEAAGAEEGFSDDKAGPEITDDAEGSGDRTRPLPFQQRQVRRAPSLAQPRRRGERAGLRAVTSRAEITSDGSCRNAEPRRAVRRSRRGSSASDGWRSLEVPAVAPAHRDHQAAEEVAACSRWAGTRARTVAVARPAGPGSELLEACSERGPGDAEAGWNCEKRRTSWRTASRMTSHDQASPTHLAGPEDRVEVGGRCRTAIERRSWSARSRMVRSTTSNLHNEDHTALWSAHSCPTADQGAVVTEQLSPSGKLIVSREGPVTTITLNRPGVSQRARPGGLSRAQHRRQERSPSTGSVAS